MDKYAQTIKSWDQLAQQYQDAFMDLSLYDESYDDFCQLLQKKNASILEIGCGPGNVTKYLLNKRSDFKIHATDVSPSMLKLAKKNNPTATIEVLDARNINQIQNNFDAILCGFCLPYLNEVNVKNLIKDSAQLLDPQGLIYISLIEGDYMQSKLETSSDKPHTMFVHYYSELFISAALESNYFSIEKIIRIPYPNKNGVQSSHLIFIARKHCM
jgi:ubiquinone/menaquinone biosynthesis C-methylase UbiE